MIMMLSAMIAGSGTRRRRRGPRRWELRLLSSLLAVSSRHPSVHFFTNIQHIEIDQLVGVSENDHVLTLGGFLYEFFGKAVPFIILAGVFFFSLSSGWQRNLVQLCLADHCLLIIVILSSYLTKSFPVHPHSNHQHTIPI